MIITLKVVSESNTKSKLKSEKIIETAKKRFKYAAEKWHDNKLKAIDDFKFRSGDQWPEEVKQDRESDGRPCLTINRIPQFVRQITNEQRQNRPSLRISPVDDKGDLETAKIYQGLVRNIWTSSNADLAIDTAFDHSATGGFGFFRVITDYVDPMSFDLEPKIERIADCMSVLIDPDIKLPDGSDAEYGFIFQDYTRDSFESEFPEAELCTQSDWETLGHGDSEWLDEDHVRVVEYLYKEYEDIDLVLLSDGSVFDKAEIQDQLPEGLEIINTRKTKVAIVKWCKLTSHEVLEETEWIGSYIPIIPVFGEEIIVDGKRIFEGVVRHAKDPQRMYNYWKSTETETIALAPKAPYIGYAGQFEGFESQWQQANRKAYSYLEVNPTMINGAPAPLPQRNISEPPVAAITQAAMLAADDMKATTGIYDSALGARSNEQSGVAIQRRKLQAQTSNFHLIDNLTRSIRHCGKILLEIIPYIYDAPRVARIIGEEGNEEIVLLNQIFQYKGKPKQFNLNVGKYDVICDTGPSFATKREEAAASIAELTRSYPQLMQVAGDLLVKNLDWPQSQEIAERLKKTLPPNIAADENQGQAQLPPEAQAQMQQMDQMIQQLNQQLLQAQEQIKIKAAELESKERIEFAKMEVDLQKEAMKAAPNQAMELMLQEIAKINTRLQLLDMNEPIEQDLYESGADHSAIQQEEMQMPTDGPHQVL